MWSTLRTASIAFVVAIAGQSWQPASATTFAPFNNLTELVPTIPGDGTHVVLYSQPITNSPGQLLEAVSEIEVTNWTENHPAHVWVQLILSDQPDGTTGTILDGANEKLDIRPGNHHLPRLKAGMKTLGVGNVGTPTLYLNLVVWTDSGAGYDITVDGGKGHLEGLVITPSTGASFSVYDSGDNSELSSTLPGDNQFHAVYSVSVGDLAINDLLFVFGDAQVAAPGAVSDIEHLTANLLRAKPDGSASTPLNAQNTFNIVPEDPTGNPVKVAVYQVADKISQNLVQLQLRSTIDLNLGQGAGRLEVLKIRPAP